MSLRKHLQSIAAIDQNPALKYMVRTYFDLGSERLSVALRRAGLGQADLVLCLLRLRLPSARRMAESLIGHPITVAPAVKFTWRANGAAPTVGKQPVITWVMRDPPTRRSTRLDQCFAEFRVGRTRQQLLARGVSRGDIRRAARRGWIRMAE